MPRITGTVIPTPSAAFPFRAEIQRNGQIVMAVPVMSKPAGEARIDKLLAEISDLIETDDR